jgi:hypothetical protein
LSASLQDAGKFSLVVTCSTADATLHLAGPTLVRSQG